MRILLIDADVIAYQAAASAETAIEWEDGYWTWGCDFDEVCISVDRRIALYMDDLGADEYRLCLTDRERNFRLDILPTYKGNRKNVKKPLVMLAVSQWMLDERDALIRPRLEGDDVMGILSTWGKLKGEKIIVSIDKDMKTIPGLYCRDLETGIVEITEEEADYNHLFQTLTGDTTDGYSGCPGIGPKKAAAILEDDPSWDAVLQAFQSNNLNETVALQQARVARILRASDYDFKLKQPILWEPV